MKATKLYYSTHQERDGIIRNIWRSIIHYKQVINLLENEGIEGASIQQQLGFWQGKKEKSWMMLLVGDYHQRKIRKLARKLAKKFNQDSIMVEYDNQYLFINQ